MASSQGATATAIVPEITLSSGKMPVFGLGTSADPPVGPDTIRQAILQAIEHGYRHFDTAPMYNSERALRKAVAEAVDRGLIKSRSELFISSKLWCSDAHADQVLLAIKKSLRRLNMEYLDLYLIHWPVSAKACVYEYPIKKEDFKPMDFKAVWAAMEECQKCGLTKAIGVSNFSCKKLSDLLAIAKIPPAVIQVEVNPCWQQKALRYFCKERGILVVAYAPLGSFGTSYGTKRVMESKVLQEIAKARNKTVAQVCLRWAYEQGIGVVVKSFNQERMKENLEIFDWKLTKKEVHNISAIPQTRACLGHDFISLYGPFESIKDLWDGEL